MASVGDQKGLEAEGPRLETIPAFLAVMSDAKPVPQFPQPNLPVRIGGPMTQKTHRNMTKYVTAL